MRVFEVEPWPRQTAIIIGIDIGTTYTAVSFAYLYPGSPQALMRVSKWPGQEAHKGESKIPTLIYYNRNREAVCFGAEALGREALEQADEQGWSLAQHFKLHLHPHSMTTQHHSKPDPLPDGVSIEQVYRDFMIYLMKNTQQFFETRVVNGQKIWEEHGSNKTVVLSHPNGWTLNEQTILREAAIQASYVSRCKAATNIRFVTEGEASVHFCLFHSNLHNELKPNMDFIVCDAGGSTIDITSYNVKTTTPIVELEEKKASACIQAGGIYVDLKCRKHLASLLHSLGLANEDCEYYLQEGVEDFESSTKKSFDLTNSEYRITMRSCNLSKPEIQMRRGSIKVLGETIQSFFDEFIDEIILGVQQQMKGLSCKHLLLVGGFGESPYLRQIILSKFNTPGCAVTIANEPTSKAASDGAVIWCAKSSVISRATRMKYGTHISIPYDAKNPAHRGRRYFDPSDGRNWARNSWSQIVDRGVVMNETKSISRRYLRTVREIPRSLTATTSIYAWTDEKGTPGPWLANAEGYVLVGFEHVCNVHATVNNLGEIAKKRIGADGVYYEIAFRIALRFGGTELYAQLEWDQNGITRSSPATIIPRALKGA